MRPNAENKLRKPAALSEVDKADSLSICAPDGSVAHGLHCLLASLLATPASLGANPAMLMVFGVPITFFRTQTAGRGTSLQHSTNDSLVRTAAARRHGACCRTYVRAVHIQANALDEFSHFFFAQTGISTCHAGLSAVVTLLYTTDKCVIGITPDMGMCAYHFPDVHGSISRERVDG